MMMICQLERSFPSSQLCRVLWIGVCLISPRRAGKHYCQLRYIGGLSKETGKRQKREVPLLFSGVTGCTKTSSVDNCYSSSFISVFEAEHEDLQTAAIKEDGMLLGLFLALIAAKGSSYRIMGSLENGKQTQKAQKHVCRTTGDKKISSQQFWFQFRFWVWNFEFSRHFQTG